jgi:hypothetical protein
MDQWLTRARDSIAAASGRPPSELDLDRDTTKILLELARVAAHESGQRTNAPLLCYLVGRAGGDVDELARAVLGEDG